MEFPENKFYRDEERRELYRELLERNEKEKWIFDGSIYIKHHRFGHCYAIRFKTETGERVTFYTDLAFPRSVDASGKSF